MKQVVFTETSLESIKNYIIQIKLYYFELYSNTGIWSESFILDEYDKKTDMLFESIIDSLSEKMKINPLPIRTVLHCENQYCV